MCSRLLQRYELACCVAAQLPCTPHTAIYIQATTEHRRCANGMTQTWKNDSELGF